MEAARLGDAEQIAELLKQGVRISCKDNSGYSALHWASLYGHIDVCTLTYICLKTMALDLRSFELDQNF
jgi:ankyrin repeat protein